MGHLCQEIVIIAFIVVGWWRGVLVIVCPDEEIHMSWNFSGDRVS